MTQGRIRYGFLVALAALGLGALVWSSGAVAQMMQGHGGGHGMGMMHGRDGTGHDEVTMPGLRGLDATPEESAEMAEMFRKFPLIVRQVETLPNGIRAVTGSEDPELMAIIVSHVTGMIARVEEGRDPMVFIQSPTIDILFERRQFIETAIEVTEAGIVVVQTSDDPEVVAALHSHAAEVSDMAARGMQSVHERIMRD